MVQKILNLTQHAATPEQIVVRKVQVFRHAGFVEV